ncbi:MAG TPA: hypothetical protein VMF66_16155 [Candidatus Acidoferrum sp.]|nr:hypothetical protein [Candidatus Acidoferrum sp.]
MHFRAKHYFTALFVVAFLALPVWAHTDSAQLTVLNPTTISGQQLKPGTYKLEVQPNQTQMKVVDTQTAKTVAEVPVHWVTVKKAPNSTEVILNHNQVNEVEFSGKTQAIQIG